MRERAPAERIARLPYYPWLVVARHLRRRLMGQLDASIVQLALPALRRDFMRRYQQ